LKSDLENLLNFVDSRLEHDSLENRLFKTLETRFGHHRFRPFQFEISEAILAGSKILATLPTGYGKSLCFQLPALLCSGLTIVVSPLISLMKNQVDQLLSKGYVEAACINSHVSLADQRHIMSRIQQKDVKLLYVSPERFRSRSFLEDLGKQCISSFVVDEAHCISQWGHDFRPDYLALSDVIKALSPNSIALFTATATDKVEKDILKQLKIKQIKKYETTPVRSNLAFSVVKSKQRRNKFEVLSAALECLNGKGIIYVSTRSDAEEVASFLKYKGISSDFYHAGRSRREREMVQVAFFDEEVTGLRVIAATNAFGLGINKENIRFVIHFSIPGNLEAYYQEAGRAGRDGKPAECMLLYCEDDLRLQRWYIKKAVIGKKDLQKIYIALESAAGYQQFRWISPGELEWKTGSNNIKARVILSHLQRLGFIKLHARDSISFSIDTLSRCEGEVAEASNLPDLTRHLHIPQYCQEHNISPTEVITRLHDAKWKGILDFEGQNDCMLIECRLSSNHFENLTEDQLGIQDFVKEKKKQLEQMIHYAVTHDCRQRLLLSYFGEQAIDKYRCGLCDSCRDESPGYSEGTKTVKNAVASFFAKFDFAEDSQIKGPSSGRKERKPRGVKPKNRGNGNLHTEMSFGEKGQTPKFRKIVCLANSRKYAGSCIAGKEIVESGVGRWLRPVGMREKGELYKEEITFSDGMPPRLLDIISMPVVGSSPHPFQTENHFIAPDHEWYRNGTYSREKLNLLCDDVDCLWINEGSSSNGMNDRISFVTAEETLGSSLLLIEPENLTITVTEEFDRKMRVRGKFTYKDERYWLAVTDPEVEKKYTNMGLGEFVIDGDVFMTISVGEPYHEYCYKLVASIIEF
jgi:RecQ family ATP-dependent DNA helicase